MYTKRCGKKKTQMNLNGTPKEDPGMQIRQENERNKTQKEQTANSKMVDLNSSILLVLH